MNREKIKEIVGKLLTCTVSRKALSNVSCPICDKGYLCFVFDSHKSLNIATCFCPSDKCNTEFRALFKRDLILLNRLNG